MAKQTKNATATKSSTKKAEPVKASAAKGKVKVEKPQTDKNTFGKKIPMASKDIVANLQKEKGVNGTKKVGLYAMRDV
jgi:hypothetical protein